MKKIFYMIWMMSFALAWSGCGGGGDDDGIEPPDGGDEPGEPTVAVPKVGWTLKSEVTGMDDAGLKEALTHARVYVYDEAEKLVAVEKGSSVDALKSVELEAGTYTAVFVGNVPGDEHISTEVIGSTLDEMSVVLTKAEGATHYTPLGDVMHGKATFTVGEEDMTAEIGVKRTQAMTRVGMTDYSGVVSEAGVMVPGVGTRMNLGGGEWSEPGTVFVTMGEGARSRAEVSERNYSVEIHVAVVADAGGTGDPGTSGAMKVQCNIVARDDAGKVVMAQVVDVPAEVKPSGELSLELTVREEVAGSGELSMEVEKAEVTDETGVTEEVAKEEIVVEESSVAMNPQPGDWETGATEDAEIGSNEGYIRPGGTESGWETGSEETVQLDSTARVE